MDMGSTGVKFSGGKIVPHSVLRAGTTSGNPWQRLKHRNHELREVDYTRDDWRILAEDRKVWRAYVHAVVDLWVR